MQVREHREVAQEFLEASDRYFDAGDRFQGSEKLWGAASHALIAVISERGWRGARHRDMKNAAERLAVEYDDRSISEGYLAAEKFHRNFYHGFLEDYEIELDGPKVHNFVARMLALAENGAPQEPRDETE